MMYTDEEISNNILRTNESKSQHSIHEEDIEVGTKEDQSMSKVNIAWEHWSLLIEEYLLCIDVKM
jgi:hypothetical protein